jgi:hypothetical protein
MFSLSKLILLFALIVNVHGKGLLKKQPRNVYKNAKSAKHAYLNIIRKNRWGTNLASAEIDTMGTFDVNGLPVYIVNMFSMENLDYEEFHIVYERKGRFYYSLLGTSKLGRKLMYEQFKILSKRKIHIMMYFKETAFYKDTTLKSETTLLTVMTFNQQQKGKFQTYQIPVRIKNDYQSDAEYVLDVELIPDNLISIKKRYKIIHKSQVRLIGDHKIN